MTRPSDNPDLPEDHPAPSPGNSQDSPQDSTSVPDTLENGNGKGKGLLVKEILDRRPGKRCRLETISVEAYERFLGYVRIGAYDRVAATCIGVSTRAFQKWLAKARDHEGYLEVVEAVEAGEAPEEILDTLKPDPLGDLYLKFAHDLEEAKGQARLIAETDIYQKDYKWWLTHGYPRKDWSPNIEVQVAGHVEHAGQIQHQFPASEETVVGALAIFQELGFIVPTPEGKLIFDALSSPEGDGDGDGQPEN